MTSPRTPRQWVEGDAEPTDRPPVKDRRATTWTWSSEWRTWVTAWREESPWSLLVKLAGPLVEVLPETPEPAETPITTSVEDKIFAPWDNETVDALNDFQVRLVMHPFTCGAEHFTPGEQVLIATPGGWICPCSPACGYTQGWAHSFMADREAWPEQMSVRAWDRVAEGLPPAQSSQDVPIPLSESVETNGGGEDADGDLRAALRDHLVHCGFVDPEDGTVPIFTGKGGQFAWTAVEKLVDALLARFEIRDRQSPLPAVEVEWGVRSSPNDTPTRTDEANARHIATYGGGLIAVSRTVGPWSRVTACPPGCRR